MKKHICFFFYLNGMILFLPFIITIFLKGVHILDNTISREERYLPLLLVAEIFWDMPYEVLRAQSVLVRTNYRVAEEEKASKREQYEPLLKGYHLTECWQLLEHLSIMKKAVDNSEKILTYQQKVKWVPYHYVNNGNTREGKEVVSDGTFSYLSSVESPMDRKAKDYLWSRECSKEFMENIQIISRDSAGYVQEVLVGKDQMRGEQLRQQLQLPSSAFFIQKTEERYRILCKGKGHGLGLSQYGATVLAQEEKTYLDILEYYFPQMEIQDYR